jgi:hypothetical protein
MKSDKVYYVWKYGIHYHQDMNCVLLADWRFEVFGYRPVSKTEIKKRGLLSCNCVTDEVK